MANFYANYPSIESAGSSGNPAAGPTGSPVPGDADYIGFSVAGVLTGVSAATPLPVTIDGDIVLANVNIADFGGTPVTIGQGLMAVSMPVVIASDQSAIQVTGSGNFTVVQPTGSNLHVDVDNFPATQPVSGTVAVTQSTSPWVDNITQFGSNPVVTGTGASGLGIPRVTVSNDSNILATQSGTWNITNISGTVSLPTGASTSANQTNGAQKTQVVDGADATVGPVQTLSGTNYLPVVLAASATPGSAVVSRSVQVAGSDGTNAQTLSTDSTGKLNINTIAGTVKTSSPVNANGTFSGSISVTTSEASTAAPANAIGVVFEAESSNAVNIRWGVSNSAGAILSTSSGVLMEPGRSIDFLPIGFGTYLHYIATAAGANVIDIQWILSA